MNLRHTLRKPVMWLPLLLGAALLGMLYLGLENPGERIVASNLVGKELPEFTTEDALEGFEPVRSVDLRDGKPRLVNVFASWCAPCIQEIPVLMRMASLGIEIDGIAVHDRPADISRFLSQTGNPYRRIGLDNEGRAQLEIGSSGVPETFVIDGEGKIVYQHIGIVTEEDIPHILAQLREPG